MASLYGVAPDQFLVTRGGDDAIDLLCRTFLDGPGDKAAVCVPSFSAYAHFARLQGAGVVEIPLDEKFDLNPDAVIAAVRADPAVRLLFLCTPNNPTGNAVNPADVLAIVDALPDVMILADEAYLEFGDTASLALQAVVRDNLLVLKTLSKAFALAGARVGGLVGPAETLGIVGRALPPYPLPTLSVNAALEALQPARRALHRQRIAQLLAERDRVAPLIAASPYVTKVYPSAGNFLFLETRDTEALASRLAADGIKVRYRPQAAPGGLRLTIGTPQENDAALARSEEHTSELQSH